LLDSGALELMTWPYRNYSTYLGRWLQAEKLGIIPNDNKRINPFYVPKQYQDGMNLYQAFRSEPVLTTDLFGLKKPEKCLCGPAVDVHLLEALKRMVKRVRKLPKSEKGPIDGARFLLRNGMQIDLLFKPTKNCPSGKYCRRTLMLCNVCLHASQINNMVFGAMAKLVGVWRLVRDLGAWIADPGHDEGPVQWGAYDVGGDIAKARPSTVEEMCSSIKSKNLKRASSYGKYQKCCGKCPDPAPKPSYDFSKKTWKGRRGRVYKPD